MPVSILISSYHSWGIEVNNIQIQTISCISKLIFPDAINYFIFKSFPANVFFFSWNNILEWKILELVLLQISSQQVSMVLLACNSRFQVVKNVVSKVCLVILM